MEVITKKNYSQISGSGGGGGTGAGSTGYLVFETLTAGLQNAFLPANILVTGVVAKYSDVALGVSLGINGVEVNDYTLFIDTTDFTSPDTPSNQNKSFAPNVYLNAATQLFSINTATAVPFKFIITFTRLTGF